MKQNLFKSLFLTPALLLATIPLQAQQQVSQPANYRGEYKQGEVIVKFKDDKGVSIKVAKGKTLKTTGISSLDRALKTIGLGTAEQLMPLTGAKKMNKTGKLRLNRFGKPVDDPNLSRLYMMTFEETAENSMQRVIKQLEGLDEVQYAYPNYYVYAQSDGEVYDAEPMRSQQWYLDAIKLPQLWNVPKLEGNKRPVIAIIDTGVDITHPDLADNIWTNAAEADGAESEDDDANGFVDDLHGWNFVQHNAKMEDRNGHGTHCAGIAAAVGNNGIGITGANPDAYIMPVTVMEPDGVGTASVIIQGIDYAIANGADVLSMSFGSGSAWGYDVFQKAYQVAILTGAAGNAGQSIYRGGIPSGLSFPGAFDVVLGVQASNEQNTQAGFSNFDPDGPYYVNSDWYGSSWYNYEIWAPGQNILSTYPGGTYKSMNGTSMATPLVAGAVSRLLQTKEAEYYRDVWIGDIVAAKAQDSIIVMEDYHSGTEYATSIFDAMAAYNFDYSNRKARLSIPLVEIDDTEGGDGDGIIDVGETIKLWPTLRSEWGLANNVTFSVMANPLYESASNVEVLENNVDFGYSLNRASLRSKNPLVIKVADKVTDGHILKLRVTATCDNIINDVEQDVQFKVENIAEVSGVINEDMTLYPDKHYVVKKNIAIPQGVTLTIMPGTRLEFYPGCYIQSEGKLIANGKPDSLIVFTSRDPKGSWGGICSHRSYVNYHAVNDNEYVYTNADTTLFTLAPTDVTPIKFENFNTYRYFSGDWQGKDQWNLYEYLTDFHKELWGYVDHIWMNGKQDLMTDPNFITPPMLQMLSEYRDALAAYPTEWSEEYPQYKQFYCFPGYHDKFLLSDTPCDTIAYCVLEHVSYNSYPYLYLKDCILDEMVGFNGYIFSPEDGFDGLRNNFLNSQIGFNANSDSNFSLRYSNFVNFMTSYGIVNNWLYSQLPSSNLIQSGSSTWNGHEYILRYIVGRDNGITTDHAEWPSWLGTGKEEIIRPYVYDSKNPMVDCFTTIDLSNMPTRPIREAHGIVWKVVVDGYDAQDDFAEMPPLGVGRHKFEVYYNRDDMDTNYPPTITMGTYEPYTQIPINEDGSWSVKDGVSVYTAYLNVNGKLSADGLNRIVVTGGKDHDHFDIPDERWRFNVLVQAAGSMATGFAAEAGMGNVKLTWNNENNDFEDAMGFNLYRYNYVQKDSLDRWGRPTGVMITVPDTVRLNQMILDLDTDQFTDYEVTPGETYFYYYKVLSTDLKEYDISNVVAATPLTSTLGDANASGEVDVADVITTVNYAAGMEPRPFIFEAADVNVDTEIDILDVIGIIRIITNPNAAPATASIESVATYWVKDGVVWLETPVDLAGVQVSLDAPRNSSITPTEDLDGFEKVSTWLADNDYLFLAYNMAGRTISAGRHPILNIGESEIADIRLSDNYGHNVMATPSIVTAVETINADGKCAMPQGIYDMMGRKISSKASDLNRLPHGIYIVNGLKVVR